jgi:hypothetical protein
VANAINAGQKAHNDVARETGGVVKHGAKEAGNLVENVGEAATTAVKYVGDRVESTVKVANAFFKRLDDGKPFDAVFNFGTDTLNGDNKDLAKAMQRSSLLRTGAQVAASFYGGPAGGAAFTVWLTYNSTGSLDKAIRSGAISYAASYVGGAIKTPSLSFERIATNTVASGVVSGAATAANGGDFKAGALNGMTAYLANVGYQTYTTAALDMKPGGEPYCKLGTDPSCAPPANWSGDMRKLDPARNHIGRFSETAHPTNWAEEGSTFMRSVNKAPGTNANAYLHDTASVDLKMPPIVNEVTIVPAIVFTYYANGAGRDRELLDTAMRQKRGD